MTRRPTYAQLQILRNVAADLHWRLRLPDDQCSDWSLQRCMRLGWVANGTRYRGDLFLTEEGEAVLHREDPNAPRRRPMDGVPPEVVRLHRAMHCPHFMRELRAWGGMRRAPGDTLPAWDWSGDAGYCLDRTEAMP